MSIHIVVESLFGNSDTVAAAIAEGARAAGVAVGVTPVASAPAELDPEVTLLVLGGPTHAFSMTRPTTRAEAHTKYGAPDRGGDSGIREWIDRATPRPDLHVVTFDTRVQVKLVPGSAAKSCRLQPAPPRLRPGPSRRDVLRARRRGAARRGRGGARPRLGSRARRAGLTASRGRRTSSGRAPPPSFVDAPGRVLLRRPAVE